MQADPLYRVLMPRSHICPICLAELARVPAVHDPHYALPIVVCPRCTTACVRTRHPDQQFWRGVRRFRQSLRQLLLALVFTALSVGGCIAMSMGIMPLFTDRRARLRIPTELEAREITVVLVAVVVVLLVAVAIRAIYAHQRFWVAWLILMVPTVFFISIDSTAGYLLMLITKYNPDMTSVTLPSKLEIARRYESLLLITPVVTGGMLVGSALNRHIANTRSKQFIKIRRKLRKRQAKQN